MNDSNPDAARPPEAGATAPDDRIRIFLAEDEAIIRLDLKETLIAEHYNVVGETGRGDTAVELIRALKPDVAILDIEMPGQDGIATARELAAERLCAVVILTAFSQRDLVERARDAGAITFLVKPFQKSELVPAIELALARHREMSALVAENERLGDQLETRKIVDRAKGVLMDTRGMTEADAFGFLQKSAMESRRTMRQVAEEVLADQ